MVMNKSQLLEEMRSARWEWEFVLSQVEEALGLEPTMHGGWSVKDTVGHVAYYERWLLNWLEDAVRGKVRAATYRELLSVDERNALIYAENKELSMQDIESSARPVFERLYNLVQTLPEADLNEPFRFNRYIEPIWGRSLPLWECIAGDSYSHYAEHSENIRRWLVVNSAREVIGLGSRP